MQCSTVVFNILIPDLWLLTACVNWLRDLLMEGKRLYVGNLTYSVNEAQLRELFSKYGDVVSAKVIEQKGFGFVEMGTPAEAQAAMDALNQTVYEGRTLRIDEARPMQPRRDFDRGGYGGGGGGGRRY
jgi:RNA recognition motif-containing protein